jgi:hypothetical protein
MRRSDMLVLFPGEQGHVSLLQSVTKITFVGQADIARALTWRITLR